MNRIKKINEINTLAYNIPDGKNFFSFIMYQSKNTFYKLHTQTYPPI